MGSACTKSDAEGIIDDERAVDLEKEDINEDEKNGVDLVDAKKTEKGDSESIMSTSSGSSRPPTPFSRPVTATVIQRPKTTTISERAELNMTEEGEETNEDILEPIEESLAPPKVKRTLSRNGVDSENHKRLSKHIAEDDEDIIKMKEYMEQKGL
eukprot:TRINITY_DN21823_c0_g1_i2.p1 TRINITY_DN21823_c0_g1~~TRINITY_DN21823_c0_g1_i2.p1  ORF type:complete len:155 (-),score=56.35 TRINITY_DN21823_c0_g1_i2:40-504(-)